MKRVFKAIVLVLVVTGLYLTSWPVPIEPIAWRPSADPGLSGPFAPNDTLASIDHLAPVGEGPEDVTRGPDGMLYTGLQDGRIVRFSPDDENRAETFTDAGGRPLGMAFDAAGNLIVADAFRGLLSITPAGDITLLTDSIDGRPMIFPNDLDIASDGKIWFSDASQRFTQANYMLDFLEGRATGRLLSYDPETGEAAVHVDGLAFANGIALGPNEDYVLICETLRRRVTRYWIRGERAGTTETFIGDLPGHPDNISFNGAGVFWVAMPATTFRPIESMAESPFLRKVLLRVPGALSLPIPPFSFAIGLDTDGRVVHNLQDPAGGYSPITSVNEFDGHLYFGSIGMSAVGRLPVPVGR